jgi:hypothetical protein
MRIANVAGRAVMAHRKEPTDVFEASGGRFGPSPSAVFDRWAEFRPRRRRMTMAAGRRCRPETAIAGHSRNEERARRAGHGHRSGTALL